jgi:solute carrier family 30 (zinc transporter), member 2
MVHDHSHDHHPDDHGHSHGHHDHKENHHDHEEEDHEDDEVAKLIGSEDIQEARRRQNVLNRLYTASVLCSCFIVVEVVGGLWANSLAILSDAAHLFADLASFAVAIAASYLASMPATPDHTFGLRRTESLAALFSMTCLAFVSVGLGYEAIYRFVRPPEALVEGKVMSIIASIGVAVNIALAAVLGENHTHLPGMDHSHDHDHGGNGSGSCDSHGHDRAHHAKVREGTGGYQTLTSYQMGAEETCTIVEEGHSHEHEHEHAHHAAKVDSHDGHGHSHSANQHEHCGLHVDEVSVDSDAHLDHHDQRNINLRAAYLHVMADLAQSVAVLIAGLIIWVRPDWHIIDPILTLLFACLVLYSTLGVLRLSIAVLLEATPPNVSWKKVYDAIRQVPNVYDVHDLHIWSIAHGMPTLSVHCQSTDPTALRKIRDQCLKFGISHATIQVQRVPGMCVTCGDNVGCSKHLSDIDD